MDSHKTKVAKLHELIQMAERDIVFEAKTKDSDWFNQTHFKYWEVWKPNFITADWTVRMKREPRVIYHWETDAGTLVGSIFDSKEKAAICGKPVKFIEVLDEEN